MSTKTLLVDDSTVGRSAGFGYFSTRGSWGFAALHPRLYAVARYRGLVWTSADFLCSSSRPLLTAHCSLPTAHYSRTKPSLVFARDDERLNHFRVDEVAIELIQLIQPEVVSRKVQKRFRWLVRVTT